MLRDEIIPYIDGDGLVAPYLANPNARSSDNGVMFTSEYYIMLSKRGELLEGDQQHYLQLITSCMVQPGLVARAPDDTGEEAPDDYYGLFAGLRTLGLYDCGAEVLSWGLRHFGSYDVPNPSVFTFTSMLFRQLQLMAAAFAAANKAHWYTFWLWPLYWFSAIIIATSCIGTPVTDADSRRLCWLLIQAVSPVSLTCRLASLLWFNRLYSAYPDGMCGVARYYYQNNPEHPFIKYWVTR